VGNHSQGGPDPCQNGGNDLARKGWSAGNLAGVKGGLSAQPGETWYFQLWFRDSFGSTATNTSSSVRVTLR
jgi:hypothetical protein